MPEGRKIIQIKHLEHKITQQYMGKDDKNTTKTSYRGTDHNRWSKAALYCIFNWQIIWANIIFRTSSNKTVIFQGRQCHKGKGKASSLDIAPLTILNSGTFTTSEVAADWQWTWYRGARSGSPQPALTGYWAHSCSQQAYYTPVNHARSSPRNPRT